MEQKLFELGKKSKKIFTKINDDYCLVTKMMPVEDEQLDIYLKGINDAREAGINIAEVIDYQLIPDTTLAFGEGRLHFTRGVFVERLAKGTSNEPVSMYIRTKEDNDISNQVNTYLASLDRYVNVLTERANMSQKLFDKFVRDCLDLENYGITIDPKPSNFFIDPEEGVTIIDPIPFAKDERLINNDHFPSYALLAFFGWGRPTIRINGNDYSVLTPEQKARLITAYAQIDAKVSLALRKVGFEPDVIRNNLSKYYTKYTFKRVTSGNIMDYLLEGYFTEMEKDNSQSLDDNSVTKNDDGTITLNITV